jgi:two-component system response regulator ChvI
VSSPGIISDGIVTIAPEKHSVSFKKQAIRLTKRDFSLVAILASHPDTVRSKALLADSLNCKSELAVCRHVSSARRKFREVDADFAAIMTFRGEGYAWAGWLS